MNHRAVPSSSSYNLRTKHIPGPKRYNWALLSLYSVPDVLYTMTISMMLFFFFFFHTVQNMGQNICFNEIAGLHSIANVLLKMSLVNVVFIQFTVFYAFQVKCTCSASQKKCYTAAAPVIIKCWKDFSCWYRISGKTETCFYYAGLILANATVGISNLNKEVGWRLL